MAIDSFIRKISVQTAVYWSGRVPDGYGGYTFQTGVEIPVRWESKTENIINRLGNNVVSRAKVFVNQDIDNEGYLYLGKLTDLTTEQKIDPLQVPTAYPIQTVEKIPMIKSNKIFVKFAYL